MQPIPFWCTVLCRSYCLGLVVLFAPLAARPCVWHTAVRFFFVSLDRFMEGLHYGHFINCESARPTGA